MAAAAAATAAPSTMSTRRSQHSSSSGSRRKSPHLRATVLQQTRLSRKGEILSPVDTAEKNQTAASFGRNARVAVSQQDGIPHRPRKRPRLDLESDGNDDKSGVSIKNERENAGKQTKADATEQYPIRSKSKNGSLRNGLLRHGITTRRQDTGSEGDGDSTAAVTGPRRGRLAKEAAQPPPTGSLGARGTQTDDEKEARATKSRQKYPDNSKSRGLEEGSKDAPGLVSGVDKKKASTAAIAWPEGTLEARDGGLALPRKTAEKRSLRSQDGGSRTKSELSLYFPNYDEFISNEPKEAELLKAETRLFITEEPPKSGIAGPRAFVQVPPQKVTPRKRRASQQQENLKSSPRANASALTHYTTLDFASIEAKLPRSALNGLDPFAEDVYAAAHRRSERQEKQLRNIEKERAQHEKVQLERLYDGLRGHDWLRVMGISGVTESERKGWEGKRAYFVREVGALLEKFKLWKEEERRRKVEKEQMERDAEEEDSGDEEEENEEDAEVEQVEISDSQDDEAEDAAKEVELVSADTPSSGPSPRKLQKSKPKLEKLAKHLVPSRHKRSPNSADVDALAAQQLHAEALLSSTSTKHPPLPSPLSPSAAYKTGGRRRRELGIPLPPAHEPAPPMTSFFAKPHHRVAALDKSRRSGRTQFAFGHPLPEMEELPFQLPQDLVTVDARRASARSRRAARRKGRDD